MVDVEDSEPYLAIKSRSKVGNVPESFSGFGGGTWCSTDNGASSGTPTKYRVFRLLL